MPRTNLGKNLPGMALAGLLALSAGCASISSPPATAPPTAYGASASATTRYFDPNVMPAGATEAAPAGATAPLPNDPVNAPSRPAARLCGARPVRRR